MSGMLPESMGALRGVVVALLVIFSACGHGSEEAPNAPYPGCALISDSDNELKEPQVTEFFLSQVNTEVDGVVVSHGQICDGRNDVVYEIRAFVRIYGAERSWRVIWPEHGSMRLVRPE